MNPLAHYQHDLVAFAALFGIPLGPKTQLTLRRVQAAQRRTFAFRSSRSNNYRSVLLTGIAALWRGLCFDDQPFVGVFTGTEAAAQEWFNILAGGISGADDLIRHRVLLSQDMLAVRRVERPEWIMAAVANLEELASGTDQYMKLAVIHRFDGLDLDMIRAVEAWSEAGPERRILATFPTRG